MSSRYLLSLLETFSMPLHEKVNSINLMVIVKIIILVGCCLNNRRHRNSNILLEVTLMGTLVNAIANF